MKIVRTESWWLGTVRYYVDARDSVRTCVVHAIVVVRDGSHPHLIFE